MSVIATPWLEPSTVLPPPVAPVGVLATPVLQPAATTAQLPEITPAIVRPGMPEIDGCAVLTRLKAFVVFQGTTPTLEYVFRDGNGNPVDMSSVFGAGGDTSVPGWLAQITLRIREVTVRGFSGSNPVYEVVGEPHMPSGGVVRADLPAAVTANAGIYQLSWGLAYTNPVRLVLVQNAYLSVERSLYFATSDQPWGSGPVTLGEVRIALRDSSANENVRIDDVEFADEEVVNAVVLPLQYFNEVSPPIPPFTTKNFPYRFNWLQGITAQLYFMAANWYRRNKQKIAAGGLSDDDLDRDRDYDQKAQMLWKDFTEWTLNKKVEINVQSVLGGMDSPYSRGSWW
jgi:hypothetical protein